MGAFPLSGGLYGAPLPDSEGTTASSITTATTTEVTHLLQRTLGGQRNYREADIKTLAEH